MKSVWTPIIDSLQKAIESDVDDLQGEWYSRHGDERLVWDWAFKAGEAS